MERAEYNEFEIEKEEKTRRWEVISHLSTAKGR